MLCMFTVLTYGRDQDFDHEYHLSLKNQNKNVSKIAEKYVKCCMADDPMTEIKIDDGDLRGSRSIHRIFDESA